MAQGARTGIGMDGDGWRWGEMKGSKKEKIARGLGWFNIGLGLAEIVVERVIN
jgi:hypothetical protein